MNLRYFWRSVSLVLVLWFALFPTLSYASETVTNQTYTYDWREAERELIEYSQSSGSDFSMWSVTDDDVANGLVEVTFNFNTTSPWKYKYNGVPHSWTSPMNLDVFEFSAAQSTYTSLQSSDYGSNIEMGVRLDSVDGSTMVDKGDSYNLKLTGIKHQLRHTFTWSWSTTNVGGGTGAGEAYYVLNYDEISRVFIKQVSASGEEHYTTFLPESFSDMLVINGDTFGIDCDLSAPFDVKSIVVCIQYQIDDFNYSTPDCSGYHSGATYKSGTGFYFQTNIYQGVLKITTPDETTGLLSGIIEWLRSIRDGIVNVGSGVTNVFNSILELPSRIWTFIQEGLKMLFIPSEEDISNMHTQWQDLMRDRFGAIYESGDIVHSFSETMSVNSAMVADTGGVITMPAVTANLAGTNFTFGGYEVDLVPDGFQWFVSTLKMLINIVCTILFINALKGKIEVLLQ